MKPAESVTWAVSCGLRNRLNGTSSSQPSTAPANSVAAICGPTMKPTPTSAGDAAGDWSRKPADVADLLAEHLDRRPTERHERGRRVGDHLDAVRVLDELPGGGDTHRLEDERGAGLLVALPGLDQFGGGDAFRKRELRFDHERTPEHDDEEHTEPGRR